MLQIAWGDDYAILCDYKSVSDDIGLGDQSIADLTLNRRSVKFPTLPIGGLIGGPLPTLS